MEMLKDLSSNNIFLIIRVSSFAERVTKTTQIERKTMDIEERGVKLRLTVVDTPGNSILFSILV